MKHCLFVLFVVLLFGCSNKYYRHITEYTFKSADGEPDYSNLDYWASHPYKHDNADSIPKPLKTEYHPDSTVDIFFIHPTTYTSKRKEYGWNAPVDKDSINAKTDYTTILYQASVFNEAGRIFAPRYRQANLYSYFPETKEDTTHALFAFDMAYGDIKKSFEYYLQHWNNGRPIIIASHSQGTTHAKRLLKEYFEVKPLQNKLVAAYIVGIAVEPNFFSRINACTTPQQTGCVCTWRTFKEGYIPNFVAQENFKAIVTNPISWDSSKTLVKRSENKGSILLNFNKKYSHAADAMIKEGVLWTRKPRFFGNLFYCSKNYHVADYNLYYYSIRENVKQRIVAFLKQ